MKSLRIIMLATASLLNSLAADEAQNFGNANMVVITTGLINQLAEEARTNNPSLSAADFRVRAARANVASVRTWDDPMGTFGGGVFSPDGMDPGMMGNISYGIEQKLPLWGRPKLNRAIADTDLAVRQAERDFLVHQLRSEITKALLAAALAGRVVEIGEQDLVWINTTSTATENKYLAGQAVLADTLQIQNEIATRNDALRTDRHRVDHAHIALNSLLNRNVESPWPVLKLPEPTPAVPFSEKLVAMALASEPRLKVLAQEVKQSEASAKLARNKRLPEVSFGIEGRQFSGDGGFRSGMFTLGMSLPWGNAGKYRKDYEREKDRQKAAEQDRENQVLMIREELHHFTVEIEAFGREARLQRDEIIIRANQALSSRLADWETGRGAFREVLDARRLLLESQLKAARAVAEQQKVIAELLLWAGLENAEALVPLLSAPPLLPEHGDSNQKP